MDISKRAAQVLEGAERRKRKSGQPTATSYVRKLLSHKELVELAKSSRVIDRRNAVLLLGCWPFTKSLSPLRKALLSDPSPVVRHEAAFIFANWGDERGVAPLLRALQDDPEALVRHEAAEALGFLGSHKAVLGLKKAQKDQSAVVRESIHLALLQLQ